MTGEVRSEDVSPGQNEGGRVWRGEELYCPSIDRGAPSFRESGREEI